MEIPCLWCFFLVSISRSCIIPSEFPDVQRALNLIFTGTKPITSDYSFSEYLLHTKVLQALNIQANQYLASWKWVKFQSKLLHITCNVVLLVGARVSFFLFVFCTHTFKTANFPPQSVNFVSTMSTSHSNLERSIYSISASEAQEAAQAYRAVRGEITRIEDGDNSTKSLISSAKEIIKEFSTRPDSDCVFTYGKGELVGQERPSLRLDKVLSAMLTYSRTCGGDEGQRYVASAIVACREKEGGETTATESKRLTVWELVRALAITWVTHFLFVCE